jgi:hypothetical protein
MRLATAALVAFFIAIAAPAHAQQPATPHLQDLWWAGEEESGWGLSVIQHGERLFCVLFVYEDTAHPTWYVMPAGRWNDDRTRWSGDWYWPRGENFDRYDARLLRMGETTGAGELAVRADGEIDFTYSIGAYSGMKRLRRQPFAPEGAGRIGVTDMWWGGPEQNGWGVAIIQKGDTLFSLWFTYFDQHVAGVDPGRPSWFVLPGGRWSAANVYEGRIYRPLGAFWLERPFRSGALSYPDHGPYRLTFTDANHAVLEYTAVGRQDSLSLVRQGF